MVFILTFISKPLDADLISPTSAPVRKLSSRKSVPHAIPKPNSKLWSHPQISLTYFPYKPCKISPPFPNPSYHPKSFQEDLCTSQYSMNLPTEFRRQQSLSKGTTPNRSYSSPISLSTPPPRSEYPHPKFTLYLNKGRYGRSPALLSCSKSLKRILSG